MINRKRVSGDGGCEGSEGDSGCGDGGGNGVSALIVVLLLLTTLTDVTTSAHREIQTVSHSKRTKGSVDVSIRTEYHNDHRSHYQTHQQYQPHAQREVLYTQDNPLTHGNAFSHQDSQSNDELYKENDLQQMKNVYQDNHYKHQDGMFHHPTPLPQSTIYYDSNRQTALPPPIFRYNSRNSQSFHNAVKINYASHTHSKKPLHTAINIDFTNASASLSAYEDVKARGTYLLRSGDGFLQPPRTWTAKPRADQDDTTTRDPAIPENPEGLQNPSLLVGPWEEEPTFRSTKAKFMGMNGTVVEVQSGTTAKIPCIILNKADHEMVSWIRLRDHHLITVGRQTYTNDDRFSVTYNRHRHEWTLQVRYAHQRDAGEYVCQLSTHPPMVFMSTLTVTQAWSEIGGGTERYVHEGSSVTLNCTLHQHTQPPPYVFWYHNRTMINFHTARQVSVHNTGDGSLLTLTGVGRRDSGNYTCHPPNSTPASITLHIIAGESPAAMQISGTRRHRTPDSYLLMALILAPSTWLHLVSS